MVKKFGVNFYGMYTSTKAVMIVNGRDFVLNYMYNKLPDGTIILLCIDTHDDALLNQYPPNGQKGLVRGGLPMSGWIIKPDQKDKNKCYVYLVIELDFGAFMPDFVMKKAF